MFSRFINLARTTLLANIITLMPFSSVSDIKHCATLKAEPSGSYIACPPTATTFAFIDIDTPETENLLLSPQKAEDPDDEPGNTVPPTTKNINSIGTIHL